MCTQLYNISHEYYFITHFIDLYNDLTVVLLLYTRVCDALSGYMQLR